MFSEEVIDRCLTSELWSHSCGHTMHTLSHCSRHFDNRQQHKPYGVHCACCEHIYDWGLKAGKWCRSVIWPVHSLEPPGSAYTHSNSHHATYTTVLLAKPFVPSVPHQVTIFTSQAISIPLIARLFILTDTCFHLPVASSSSVWSLFDSFALYSICIIPSFFGYSVQSDSHFSHHIQFRPPLSWHQGNCVGRHWWLTLHLSVNHSVLLQLLFHLALLWLHVLQPICTHTLLHRWRR